MTKFLSTYTANLYLRTMHKTLCMIIYLDTWWCFSTLEGLFARLQECHTFNTGQHREDQTHSYWVFHLATRFLSHTDLLAACTQLVLSTSVVVLATPTAHFTWGIGFVHSGTEVKFNHNTPPRILQQLLGHWDTTIGQHNYGGVVDDVECLLELHSSTVLWVYW